MTDDLISKLRRMAQRGTPPEAEIARAKLLTLGSGQGPPRRPRAPTGAPAPEPNDFGDFADAMRDWREGHREAATAWARAATNTTATMAAATSWVTVTTGGSNT